jgi:hypothetical protein
MKKQWMAFALLCLAPMLSGVSCQTKDTFSGGSNMLGVVKLGPFPAQRAGVGGYNLYLSEVRTGPFEKINTDPVLGYSSLMVPYLKPGQVYYFRMTAVGLGASPKESVPGPVFARTAQQSWN